MTRVIDSQQQDLIGVPSLKTAFEPLLLFVHNQMAPPTFLGRIISSLNSDFFQGVRNSSPYQNILAMYSAPGANAAYYVTL